MKEVPVRRGWRWSDLPHLFRMERRRRVVGCGEEAGGWLEEGMRESEAMMLVIEMVFVISVVGMGLEVVESS